MKAIKYLLLFVCVAACLSACKKNSGLDDFDVVGQFNKDTTAIRAFAVANNIPVVKDPTFNIFYQILAPGEGGNVTTMSNITVNYKGSLLDGTVFDETTSDKPLTFFLSTAITGWQAGLPLIKKGGRIRLLLPSYYGYGNLANKRIPANSVLDFTIDLIDVK